MYSLCNLDIEIELTWLVELLGGNWGLSFLVIKT